MCFLTSLVGVTTAGTDMNMFRATISLLMITFLCACSDQVEKEYFCESYAEEGSSQYYKQQVVQTSKAQFCVLWPSDALHCANPSTPTTNDWHDVNGELVREITSMRWTKGGAVLTIDRQAKPAPGKQLQTEASTPLLSFEFQKRAAVLTVSPQHEAAQAVVYSCKSWIKQAWWQLY